MLEQRNFSIERGDYRERTSFGKMELKEGVHTEKKEICNKTNNTDSRRSQCK
jgi:hypothetical protein